ncbi:hypothetical protein [Terrimonas pollutisoli]|uniref:hypothetical protein n=1 Tax=Terrimonas pollutisoli TaxID=3034147 RepID=UPI0023EC2EA8|nr:hypothetical protein [Terrimonas sp. H1YJ31]
MENNYPIPRNILDGFDVAGLMKKMAGADWYYDYTEDPDVWDRGINQVNDIKADLLRLSKMENGVTTANYLWDTYVPVYSVKRPDFLVQVKQNDLSTSKNDIMNQDNLNYLNNNLKFSGFGEALNAELESNIKKAIPEFTLNHSTDFNNRKMEATLYFKQGEQNEMYFFNKYDARLSKGNETLEQTFYMDKGRGFTLKEAANLLEGRAVNKDFVNSDGQKYNAWVKLDFENKNDQGNYKMQRYHENFGYDIEKALGKHSIKELEDQTQTKDLLQSLKKGNLQAATDQNGERIFIAAEPESGKANKVALYDKNLRAITVEVRNAKQSEVNGEKKGNKKQNGEGDDLIPKTEKKKVRGKAKGGDDDLLPKNKESTGKGVKI